MKKQLLCVMMLFCALTFGQELPNLIPSTPEASAMGKYGDIPIGYYTGVPNISVPLVSLSEGAITIPVSLSYHSSGIRVDEMASRVGLGWNLIAGGTVSRAVRGIPDDHLPTGYLYNPIGVDDFLALPESSRFDPAMAALRGNSDYESDIYSYNLPGGTSGKFFFNDQGSIIHMPKNTDTRIQPVFNNQKIVGWQITPASGITYYIGTSKDGTRNVTDRSETLAWTNSQFPDGPAALANYVSTWHLLDIESPNGDQMAFHYQEASIRYVSLGGQRHVLHKTSADSQCLPPGYNPISKTYLETISSTQRLTRIESLRNGSILFEYNHNRVDLKNDKALTGVILQDKNNTMVSTYNLSYGYFQSTQGNGVNYGDIDQRTKRLYLKEVQEVQGNNQNKKYSFDYYTDQVLPDRLSNSQDFWGYYNGQANGSLLPEIEYFYGNAFIHKDGANRKVYENYTKACTLKQIHYPTGGSTEFVLESNTVNGNADFFIATSYEQEQIVGRNTANDTTSEIIEIPFTISDTQDDFAFPINGIVEYDLNMTGGLCTTTGFDCPQVFIAQAGSQNLGTRITKARGFMHLNNGNYVIKIYNYSQDFGPRKDVQIFLFGRKLRQEEPSSALSGGLRVKEIINKNENGNTELAKKYTYQKFDQPNLSSGTATNPPVFMWYGLPICPTTTSYSVQLTSSPIFPLQNQAGYSVGYTNVTESYEGEKTGKTEYTYTFAQNGVGGDQSNIFDKENYPIAPIHDLSHRRGLLAKTRTQEVVDQTLKTFRPVQEVVNTYSFGVNNNDDALVKNITFGASGNLLVSWNEYTNLSESLFSKETTTKSYYYTDGQQKVVTQKQSFYYDSYPLHTQMTRSVTTTDAAKTRITKTYYPQDVSNTNSLPGGPMSNNTYAAITQLKKEHQNQVAIPVQVEQYEQNNTAPETLLSRQRTEFKDWGNTHILPEVVATAKGSSSLEPRLTYHKYDQYGNPLEVSQTDGRHIMYVWGYNNTQPIVKIDNASYTGIPAAVTTLIDQLKTTSDAEDTTAEETTMRTLFNNLREHAYFENAQLTGYTYNPLIGVTSITDPKGYSMSYEYDVFNRLEFVKDQEGKLISENKYNYKN